jgi:hypothetical protein
LYLFIDEISPCESRSIVGIMSIVSASAELIALFLAGKILKKIGTNVSSLLILIAFGIRFGGYYLIENPRWLAPIESMHFFNFGILFVLIAQYADAIGSLMFCLPIHLLRIVFISLRFSTRWSFGNTARISIGRLFWPWPWCRTDYCTYPLRHERSTFTILCRIDVQFSGRHSLWNLLSRHTFLDKEEQKAWGDS